MTQYIRGSTPGRTGAAAQWGVRDLRKRPQVAAGSYAPILFRAYIGEIADPEADRVHYASEQNEGDNVYWTHWDPDFDTSVYSISAYDQTNDPDEGLVIAGVGPVTSGLYSVHALVDVDDYFNGVTLMNHNWDEGQGEFRAHGNMGEPGEPYYGDLYGVRIDHWYYIDLNLTDAFSIEIVFSINTETAMPGISPGKSIGGTPTIGEDFWIPGGYDGAWGMVPRLVVAYWGDPGGDTASWLAGSGIT